MSTFTIMFAIYTGFISATFYEDGTASLVSVPTDYGSFQRPDLHRIISQIPCTTHVMHHNLDFHSFEVKNPTVLSLISTLQLDRLVPMEYKSLQQRSILHFYLRYYSRHRKFCYFYIFYSNPPWDSVSLGLLMRLYILEGHDSVRQDQGDQKTSDTNQVDYIYAIFVTTGKQTYFQDVTTRLPGSQYVAYLKPNIFLLSIVPNFGLLFLSDTREGNVLCVSTRQMSYPVRKELICEFIPYQELLHYFSQRHLEHNRFRLPPDFPGFQRGTFGSSIFSQISNPDIFLLVKILAPSCNVSIILLANAEESNLPVIYSGETSALWDIYHWTSTIVIVGEKNLHFITCHSRKQLSFDLYIKPFDFLSWICLAGFVLIVVGALRGFFALLSVKSETRYTGLTSLAFWTVGTLLEQVDTISGKPAEYSGFRLFLAIWLLLASVITNGYKSFVMMSLNVPEVLLYPHSFEVGLSAMFEINKTKV